MKKVLSIAGSDCSGGAGIQADLKTMIMNGVYGMSVITALTAQNTNGVSGIFEIPPEFVKKQLDSIFEDIPPDAVKIGMVSSPLLIDAIAEGLSFRNAKNIVLDPVMVATSGSSLSSDSAVARMIEKLFPLSGVITPNIPEAEALCGFHIENQGDMEKAASYLSKMTNGSVIIKGGHLKNRADDLLWQDGKAIWYTAERIHNPNTHGTGCTLSSAIACGLAKGMPLSEAFSNAKEYISGALSYGLDIGKGSGPLHHGYLLP